MLEFEIEFDIELKRGVEVGVSWAWSLLKEFGRKNLDRRKGLAKSYKKLGEIIKRASEKIKSWSFESGSGYRVLFKGCLWEFEGPVEKMKSDKEKIVPGLKRAYQKR